MGEVRAARLDLALLHQARQRRALSVPDLAAQLGVTPAAVYRWENGETLPRPGTFQRLAVLLGVPAEQLLGAQGRALSLFEARLCAGLSTQELAQAAGMAMMTYNRLERGNARRVDPQGLARLAAALHRPIDQLNIVLKTPPKRTPAPTEPGADPPPETAST